MVMSLFLAHPVVHLKVFLNTLFAFKQPITYMYRMLMSTQTASLIKTGKLYSKCTSQFSCCIETPLTFTANIWLTASIMSLNVFCKLLFTCDICQMKFSSKPSTFIVWLQQMYLELDLKRSEQCLHEHGFASVWIRTWRFSWWFSLNSFPQLGQRYGFVLLCTECLCRHKLLKSLKCLSVSHSEHLCGFSPVWTLVWV